MKGHSGACSPNNKCLCVKRVWPMRRRVNLKSVLRIGITGHAPMTGFKECSLLSNCPTPPFLPDLKNMMHDDALHIR
ncbi:hypothetical protein TNCV_4870501 [Trichonephila clavipes]|nr:hypothetical protein TNCV_4870501 [Trichonephila clavipes]